MGGMFNKTLARRAFLAQGLSALAGAAMADAPLTALRPTARPAALPPGRPGKRLRARPSPEEFVTDARLGGDVAYVLADARTGQVIQSRLPETPMPPASVTKSVTALYALDALGPAHQFRTRVMASAPVADGVLDGDLILRGGGDPVLDTEALAALATTVKETGLREVRGRFLVDAGLLPRLREIDPGQLPHLGYNPAVSGLNLNFNRVHFQWTPQGGSYAVTMDARTENYRPAVRVSRMRVVDRSLPVYTYEDGGAYDQWTVARGALGGGGTRWLPVRQPELYAGEVFQTLMRAHGIVLGAPALGTAPSGSVEIAGHASPPLAEIIRGMLLYSTNLTAEVIGLAATAARGLTTGSLASSAAVMSDWLSLEYGVTPVFADHSGLSDASRITVADMTRILTRPGTQARLEPLLKSITLRDVEGTPLADPPAEVLAKTGTLNFVSALSGYLRNTGGSNLAFTIFTGNLDRRADVAGSGDDIPPGASAWNGRSKRMQQRLLQHWAAISPAESEAFETAQGSSAGIDAPEAGNPSLFEVVD